MTVNRFTHYEEAAKGEERYEVVNVGALGFWHTIKNAKGAKLAFLGLGSIIENVEEQIPLNIYYLGLKYNLISTFAKAQSILEVIEDEGKREAMWDDAFMGLSRLETLEYWVRAANEGSDFGAASKRLKDYFILSQEEVSELNARTRTLIKLLNETAVPYYGCGVGQKYECSGRFYTALQFAT